MTLESRELEYLASHGDNNALAALLNAGIIKRTAFAGRVLEKRSLLLLARVKELENEMLSRNKKSKLAGLKEDYEYAVSHFIRGELLYEDKPQKFPQAPAIKYLRADSRFQHCWEIKLGRLRLLGFFFRQDVFIVCDVLDKNKTGDDVGKYAPYLQNVCKGRVLCNLPPPPWLETEDCYDVVSNIHAPVRLK